MLLGTRAGAAGALAGPTGPAAGVRHGEVPLPRGAAGSIADGAGALQGVAPAFATVEGDVAVGPRDATAEAAVQLVSQLLDGHDGLRVHLGAPAGVGDVVQAMAQGS